MNRVYRLTKFLCTFSIFISSFASARVIEGSDQGFVSFEVRAREIVDENSSHSSLNFICRKACKSGVDHCDNATGFVTESHFLSTSAAKWREKIASDDTFVNTSNSKIDQVFHSSDSAFSLQRFFGSVTDVCQGQSPLVVRTAPAKEQTFFPLPDVRNAKFSHGWMPASRLIGSDMEAGYIHKGSLKFFPVVKGQWAIAQPFSQGRAIVEVLLNGEFKRKIIDLNLADIAEVSPNTLLLLTKSQVTRYYVPEQDWRSTVALPRALIADYDYFAGGYLFGFRRSERGEITALTIDKDGVERQFPYSPLDWNFSDGMVPVQWNSYMTPDGSMSLKLEKTWPITGISGFSEGLAAVESYDGNRFPYAYQGGYIDRDGRHVIPQRPYYRAYRFQEGHAVVLKQQWTNDGRAIDNHYAVLNSSGEELSVFPKNYVLDPEKISGFYPWVACADSLGGQSPLPGFSRHVKCNTFVPHEDRGAVYEYPFSEKELVFSNGLIRAFSKGSDNSRSQFLGFFDRFGSRVIEAKDSWRMVRPFSEGFAPVRVFESSEYFSKWGFINTRGEETIRATYDHVAPFQEGVALVSNTDGYSLRLYVIDKNGVERQIHW